ncbi:MAG: hypothetical protein ACKVPX_00845 [Myxococcaceae bacterium]
MKLMVFLIALSGLGAAVYYDRFGPRTSFASYSDGQLQTLDAAIQAEVARTTAVTGADVSATLLRDERERRQRIKYLYWAGLGSLALSIILPKRVSRDDDGEAQRLTAFIGNAPSISHDAKARAAQLLGVAPDAPDSVIEAAYAAQCKVRDRARYDGVAPDLRQLAEHQLKELAWAKDALLGQRRPS